MISKEILKNIANSAAELAQKARIEILKMTSLAKTSHIASSFSVVDLLAVLYSGIANISPKNHTDPNRDIIIISKGHAAAAIYSVLALKKFFDLNWLKDYCADGAQLGGHVTAKGVPGVELSTGSLGHGFPYGLGIAISKKVTNNPGNIFVVISDGECDEGTTWESALIANHFNLTNLCVIVDRNRIQSLDYTEHTIALEPFTTKWQSFGWAVLEVDGHNYLDLASALSQKTIKPKCIIANTIKGKGVSFMENSVQWHYKSPNENEFYQAISEIEKK